MPVGRVAVPFSFGILIENPKHNLFQTLEKRNGKKAVWRFNGCKYQNTLFAV
jgi:hypothetical protein